VTEPTFKSPVEIGGIYFHLTVIVLRTDEFEFLYVVFSNHFTKRLMVPHSDSSQFPPKLCFRLCIVEVVEEITSSVPEDRKDLEQMGVDVGKEKK
jgi:hypothetical protein